MWSNFFAAGGWGMYPTMIFGFLLLATVALDAFRKGPRSPHVAGVLTILVLCSGLLGTAVGICSTAHYLDKVPQAEQLQTFAFGIEESLHNLVLALMIVIICGLIALVGVLRRRRTELTNLP